MPAQPETVELIGYYGDDEIIACSAWTSTSRNLSEEKRNRIPALIKQLWKDGHETPFEKGVVHFLVNCNIASHIHILKHRISSMNGESARYKELKEDKFYLPEDWKKVELNEHVYFDESSCEPTVVAGDSWLDVLKEYTELGNRLYHQSLKELTPVLGKKRAKETARFFKTYNSQIEGDLMFNMRSFANFIRLRRSKHAQNEIHDIADKMLNIIENLEGNPFKYTLEAWRESGVIS